MTVEEEKPAAQGGGEPPPRPAGARRVDAAFAVVGTGLHVGTGLILLPTIAVTLSPSALTFWYVFLTIHTLALLIEFGFTPTLSRNFTFVLSGARELEEEGVPRRGDGPIDNTLFANLLRASQRLYGLLGLCVLAFLGIGGTIYLYALARTTPDTEFLWPAWAVFLASLVLLTSFMWQTSLLMGADRMRQFYQVYIASRLVQLALSVGGLLFFPNVFTLALAFAASVIVTRLVGRYFVRDLVAQARGAESSASEATRILRVVSPIAVRQGWVAIGEFFTNRFALFAVSLALGASAAAGYAITTQVMIVLINVAQIGAVLSVPRMAAARLQRDEAAVRELFAFSTAMSLVLVIGGAVAFTVLGGPVLHAFGAETTLPPWPVLAVLGAVYAFNAHTQTTLNCITTGNRVPYLRAVLLTGLATTLAIIAVALAGGGLMEFAIVQGLTQMAFNFWRWPVYAWRETGLTWGTFPVSVLRGARRVLAGRS